jgi:adenylate kinase
VTQATRVDGPRPGLGAGPLVYVMVGAPGAGKGTQALRLAKELGLPHVSTGDLFRASLRDGSTLGTEVRRYVEKGILVPDPLTMRVVEERFAQADARQGAVLDGFPRTRPQAESLDRLLARQNSRVAAALYIEVDTPQLVQRLAGRRVCTGSQQHVYNLNTRPPRTPGICDIDGTPLEQRPDDRPETISDRLARQLPPMYEVVDHYTETGVLHAVAGDRPMDEVTADLLSVAERAAKRA